MAFDITKSNLQLSWFPVGYTAAAGVCPNCLEMGAAGQKTFAEWQAYKFGLPRDGRTRCKRACRCMVLPLGGVDVGATFKEASDLMKGPGNFTAKVLNELKYWATYDDLVLEYEILTSNKFYGTNATTFNEIKDGQALNLPGDVYRLISPTEKNKYLKKVIEEIRTGRISDKTRAQIIATNGAIPGL